MSSDNSEHPRSTGRLRKAVYTTGEVAEICNVSQQTVIRCFDNGRLRGFRVPGSRFRRIPHESLIQFMKENSIPLDRLDMGKKRVLVVDDEAAIVEMLVEVLEHDGRFEVQAASTGFEAGMMTREFRPDLILLDYLLPDINGNGVIRKLRSDPTLADVKIMIVSGVVDDEKVKELLECGANDFLKKPFHIDELKSKTSELVSA
jgi:excisionase family DNA binding protein